MATTNNALNNQRLQNIASGTSTFTISNSDDTGTSDAMLQVACGGSGTSGDAYSSFVVTGVTTWTTGIDNSDSDNFVISANASLGTTNTFVMDTSGINTLPLQPSFSCYPSVTLTDKTGGGTNYTTLFDTELFDRSNSNTTTTFTAPVTGRYCISVVLTLTQLTVTNTQSNIQFITSNRNHIAGISRYGAMMDLNTSLSNDVTRFIDMDISDTCTVTVVVLNGTNVADVLGTTTPIQSIRSGFLAC